MNCGDFETRLNAVLDERELPQHDAPLVAHAQACANCGQILAAQEALFAGLELFDPPALSAGFAERVLRDAGSYPVASGNAITRTDGGRTGWTWPATAALLAGAAAVLLALTVGFRMSSRSNPPKEATIATAQPGDSEQLSPERYHEYRALFHQWALQLPDAVVRLEAVEQYAPGIGPVRASFAVAIDTLYRTIPGSGESRTSA